MILVDLNKNYQNIPKSTHIARKKVPLLCGQKSCFFIFAPKTHLGQAKIDLCYTDRQGYQNHHHMTIHDLPFVKK